MSINCFEIIYYFYPEDTALRRLLLAHCGQVRGKALAIWKDFVGSGLEIDAGLVAGGAMLHDIGIGRCHAPGILCEGTEPYICHGVIGAEMLREYGRRHGLNLEAYARICERHTGTGITAEEIRNQKLPVPERDYLPETPEEKLVCLADKFYSKSDGMKEKSISRIRQSMLKFGVDSVARLEEMCRMFGVMDMKR